jgi:putative membrane protein
MHLPVIDILAYGDAPRSQVQLHILLRGIQSNYLALLADGIELAAIAMYLLGVRRLARRGRHWPRPCTTSFVAGIVVIWVAIGSGLAAYDEVNVVMHVVQHVLLMMVAPPLIVLAKPITLATQAVRRSNQVRIVRVLHSLPVAVLTFPVVTWLLYFGAMYAYFQDRHIYAYSVDHVLFHDATHLIFLAIGLLYWQPILGRELTRWKLHPGLCMLLTFIGMPFEAFLGISINMTTQPIDPINTLANTRAAGQVFWILAMACTGAAIAVIASQWYRQLERQTPREDRQAELQADRARYAAAQLGITPTREGWTIPAWRLAQIQHQQARKAPPRPAARGLLPAEPAAQPPAGSQ